MSRARDLADAGSKANFLDNVSADINTTYAPLASPDFTGTVDLTGTTLSLDNDQISGDKVSGGTIGAGTFNGTIGDSAVTSDNYYLQATLNATYSASLGSGVNINFDESTVPYWDFTSDSDWHVSGTGSNFSKGTTNADLKIHRAGIYIVNFSVTGQESSSERVLDVKIRGVGSGSTNIIGRSIDNIAVVESGSNYGNACVSVVYKFDANDQINFFTESYNDATANIYYPTHFNICLIRPL